MKTANNGNVPLCGAKNRQELPCRRTPVGNGQCYLHGGASTVAKTQTVLERIKAANRVHGLYTKESRERAQELRQLIRQFKQLRQSVQ